MARALMALAALSAVELLGQPLKQDGYQLRPPRDFRMTRMDLFHGTRVGGVSAAGDAPRFLSAALVDGEGEDAASMLFSVVEAPFALGPSARDELSTSTVRHFRDELGLKLALERADVVDGRVEVRGSVREGSQLRQLLVVAWPGEGRHTVAIISAPSGRWQALEAPLRESLATYRAEPLAASGPPRQWLFAFLALVGALLLTSFGLWRRRRGLRDR